MGNTAVAVLHFDMHDQIELASPRMAQAMVDMPGSDKPKDFGFGRVISWDHSSGYQVCVIQGNTGWRVSFDNDLPYSVLKAITDVLEMRGYRVTPPGVSEKGKRSKPE
jgi:hypothetical protein